MAGIAGKPRVVGRKDRVGWWRRMDIDRDPENRSRFEHWEECGVIKNPFVADIWNVTIAQIAPIMPYFLLVLILIVRPMGLLGKRET